MLDLEIKRGNHRLVPKVAIRGLLDCLSPLDGQPIVPGHPEHLCKRIHSSMSRIACVTLKMALV